MAKLGGEGAGGNNLWKIPEARYQRGGMYQESTISIFQLHLHPFFKHFLCQNSVGLLTGLKLDHLSLRFVN